MRKAGQGTIRVLPSGRYQARAWYEDRQVAAPTTFETRQDAQAWLARTRQEIKKGTFQPPIKLRKQPKEEVLTLKVYAERWLRERPLKPRTRQEYQGYLDRHILPVLGSLPIDGIAPAQIRTWHSSCCPDHPATRTKVYSMLRSVFKTAEEDEIIARNPCRIKGAGTPPAPEERTIPKVEKIAELAAAMPEDLRPMVYLAAWGGLRQGEVAGLKGEDIVLPVVHVRRTASAVKGGATLGTTKTRAGVRKVVMPPHTIEALQHLEGRKGLLFPSKRDPNKPLAYSVFHKHWDAARKAAGLPELHFHDLRHFSATSVAQVGGTTGELMSRFGHTSPRIASRYQHAVRDEIVAERLSDLV